MQIQKLRFDLQEQREFYRLRRQERIRIRTSQTVFWASQQIRRSALSSRHLWTKERYTSFFDAVMSCWSDGDFKANFRVCRETFTYLCGQLKPRLQRRYFIRRPLPVEQRVAITLWRLGTYVEYRSISHLFGVGISTVFVCIREVCEAIVDILLPRYIKVPSGDRLQNIIDGFHHKWGFPQCVGAIDGSHIPIIAPKENALDYFNRKGHHSVLMQALVACDYTFMDVYIGWPESVHDARVLANSKLFRDAEAGNLLPNTTVSINGVDVPLLILGDPPYPMLPWLMKPFTENGRLTQKQLHFNYRLNRARMVVECAFGRLKGRWRSLLKRNDTDVKFIPKYVAACCVLHNICEIHRDAFNEDWMVQQDQNGDGHDTTQPANLGSSRSGNSVAAARIRDVLCDYFEQ